MKENAQRMVNATIIAGNQWVIRGFGSDADLTQTMQQAANVSISAINGVTANATSLVSYANDFLERNHVYEFLNSTIEIPIPSSLGGNNGESDGTEATAGEGSTRSLQSAVNSTASALWSYVSYGVATSTSAVWSVVNDRIQTLIDEIDNDRLREEQRRLRALEEERKEAAKMSSIEGGLGEEIVSTNANILPSVSSRLSSGYSVVTPVKDTAPHAPTSLIKPDSNVLSSPLPVPVTPIFAHGIENPVADGKDSTDEVCDDTHASMNEPVVEHGSPTGENDVEVETGHISTVENIQAVETGLVSVADNESTDVDQSDPVADVGSPLETTTPSNSNKNTTSKKNKKNKKGKK